MHNTASQNQATSQARSVRRNSKPVGAGHRQDSLPTPPNSLSPTLPPQRATSPSNTISGKTLLGTDSDIWSDNEAKPSVWSRADIKAPITADSLAKHYLPEIFRRVNGSVAGEVHVKDILKHLRTLPNFERLDNQTGRRKVTAALEHRVGGAKGNVMYNKVKWGVWEAVPLDGQESSTGSDRSSQRKGRRPTSISVPLVKMENSITSPSVHSSNAIESDSENEADAMSLDGEPEIRLQKPQRRRRQFTPPPVQDDSEATEEEDWESMGPRGVFRAASISSYAASYSSRRGSHASTGTRPSVTGSLAVDIVGNQGAHHRRPSHLGSAPKMRYLSLPNGALFSNDLARGLTYQGGMVPFEDTYSQSLKSAAREERKRRKHSRQHHNQIHKSHKHSMDGASGLSISVPTKSLAGLKNAVEAESSRTVSLGQPDNLAPKDSEMEVARALLELGALARSPSVTSPITN